MLTFETCAYMCAKLYRVTAIYTKMPAQYTNHDRMAYEKHRDLTEKENHLTHHNFNKISLPMILHKLGPLTFINRY